jgi:hypothetical protein
MINGTCRVESFTMIAENDDQRRIVESVVAEIGQQPPDEFVGVGDLARIGIPRIAAREIRGGLVRVVWVVEVGPDEETAPRVRIPPGQHRGDHLGSVALRVEPIRGATARRFEPVVEVIETLGNAPAVMQDERSDGAESGEALGAQQFGQRHPLVVQEEPAVVAHSMIHRPGPGHQRRVRRQRQRHRGGGPGEQDPVPGQAVEMRRRDLPVAVGPEIVGPGRVEGDQQYVDVVPCRRAPASAAQGGNDGDPGDRDT